MPKPKRSEAPPNSDLLEWCESEFKRYLHVTDPGFLYVTLGTVAANCYLGKPVWLMLVGPTGCGKTDALMAIAAARPDWFRVLSDASKASFLSGSAKRERSKDATGGLLKDIAAKDIRFLVFGEYGTILAQSKDDYNQITSMQREIWDGQVHRPVGSDGGKMLDWTGKVGELAACTNQIDKVLEQEVACGVRWLIWRYPASSGWQEAMKSGENNDPIEMRECLANAAGAVIAGLQWDTKPRELTEHERLRITRLSSLSARLQGAIPRDSYHVEDVVNLPIEAYPTRLGPALSRIYLGMEQIGLHKEECWRQIKKIAIDTAPALRVAVLREWAYRASNGGGQFNAAEIAETIRCGTEVVERQLEDMSYLGLMLRRSGTMGWSYEMPVATAEEMID